MSEDRDRSIQALLQHAIDAPTERRREVLGALEAAPDMIEEVLALLAEEDEDFLAGPPWHRLSAGGLGDLGGAGEHDRRPDEGTPDIPGYTLRGLLGEGGMGRVFLAVEESTDQRLVAIKMIRMPVPDPDLVRRFEAERHAMSRLNHPAIAQLLGAGVDRGGRHYVVMEFVDGLPITRYCDARRLGIQERLELFVAVCRGVEHAHRRQLLHRDLKPSNVLITVQDGEPIPKIIDFGIARGLDRPLGQGHDTMTAGLPIGTPAYMSPEALDPTGPHDLDTRADVYSLGVVLYELLTGVRPDDLAKDDPRRWRRQPAAPPRPSRRLRDLPAADRQAVLDARGADGPRLDRRLRGDLDWIALRALAVDPDARYGSPAALADDLERSLRHEPVTARPPSLTDRLVKLSLRYRLAAALTLLTAVAVTLAAILSTFALVRTRRAEAAARSEAAAAQGAIDFLVGLFEAAKPENTQGDEITARELVTLGAESLRQEELPPLQRARLLHTLADVQLKLGDYDSGCALAYEALEIREAELDADHLDILATLDLLGSLERRAGRLEAAEPHVERLVRAREALGDPLPLAGALNTLANLRWRQERLDEAEAFHRRALDLRRGARAEAGGDVQEIDAAVSASLNNLGVLLWTRKRYDEAEPILREAAADLERRLGGDHPRVADALGNLGLAVQYAGRVEESIVLHRRVLAIRTEVLGPDHPETATAIDNLAVALAKLQQNEEAESLYHRALAIRLEALGRDHEHTIRTARNLRNLYRRTDRDEKADQVEAEFPAVALTPMPEP